MRTDFVSRLSGRYDWDYDARETRTARLYRRSGELGWSVERDVDWSAAISRDDWPFDPRRALLSGYAPYEAMPEHERIAGAWLEHTRVMSDVLHGEQAGMMIVGQLVSCLPDRQAKMFAAAQALDEARHVEFFSRYLRTQIGEIAPCSPGLRGLLDASLTTAHWDEKLLSIHVVIESLALSTFTHLARDAASPLLREGLGYVLRDEARHVNFGIDQLASLYRTLTRGERERRAQFVLRALRALAADQNALVHLYTAQDRPEAEMRRHLRRRRIQDREAFDLYSRVLPSLERIGLPTASVRARADGSPQAAHPREIHAC